MKSLLKVTSKANLGLILVSELALRKEGEFVSLEEVARKAGASRKFLEQVAGDLRRAGIIEGLRGAAGGYRLKRAATDITVAEVMDAIEGPMPLEACTAHQVKGQRLKAKGVLTRIQGQVMATLMNTTIAEIV